MLIVITFGEILLPISPRIIDGLRSCLEHSTECFIQFPNTLKLVREDLSALRFFFSVSGNRTVKHFVVFDILRNIISP